MIKKIFKYVREYTKKVNDSEVSTYAGSASFFSILSLFPIIILVANILPFTNVSPDFLFKFLGDFLPEYIVSVCHDIYFEFTSSRGALISVTAIIIFWSAGNGVWSLMNGFNAINNTKERRNWLWVHFIAIIYTVVFLAIILFFMIFMLLGDKLHKAVDANFYDLDFIYTFVTKFRFFIAWIILLILFMLMYRTLTSKKVRLIAQFPGALFASISWTIISFLFSRYIDAFGLTGLYGSFTTLIFSFFWVYWSIYFIFLGGVLNTFFESRYAARVKKKAEKRKAKKQLKIKKKLAKKGIDIDEEVEELNNSPEASGGKYE